jgi:hypothetical protein
MQIITPAQWFVEQNAHINIALKLDFMRAEDAKEAIDIKP